MEYESIFSDGSCSKPIYVRVVVQIGRGISAATSTYEMEKKDFCYICQIM